MKKEAINKKSQTGIIVTILLIVLALIFIIIIWVYISSITIEKSEEATIDPFLNRIEISNDVFSYARLFDCININIERKTGEINISEIKFQFIDQNDEVFEELINDPAQIPQNKFEKKTYSFCYPGKNIIKVNFFPIFKKKIINSLEK